MNTQTQKKIAEKALCPITLNSQDQILEDGRSCFRVKDTKGKTLQIYNAQSLSDWLMTNPEYPHTGKPANTELAELKQLVPSFEYLGKKPKPVYNSYNSANRATNFNAMNSVQQMKDMLLNILKRTFYFSTIKDLKLWYKDEEIAMGSTRPRVFWKRDSLLSQIQHITLKYIFVSITNEFELFFEVSATRDGKAERHCIRQVVDIESEDAALWYYKKNLEDEVARYVAAQRDSDNPDKLIYHSEQGEKVYTQDIPNGFQLSGGTLKKKYKGRSYTIRIGSKGGKFILVKGKKIYLPKK